MHLGIPGHDHFSYEDLQEFLGVMGDGQHHHHNHDPALLTSSTQDQPTAAMYDQTGHQTYGSEDGGGSTNTGSINNDSVAAGCGVSGNCNNGEPCEEAKAQARSERKRSREKQRRCDVNKQFANLTSVLQRIDSEEAAAARDEAEKQIASTTSSSAAVAMGRLAINPSNRVDLIGRTIHLLEHLHAANKRRKLEIDRLQEELELAKKAGEDTAMKLKEAMLAPPGEPMNKVRFFHTVVIVCSMHSSARIVCKATTRIDSTFFFDSSTCLSANHDDGSNDDVVCWKRYDSGCAYDEPIWYGTGHASYVLSHATANGCNSCGYST